MSAVLTVGTAEKAAGDRVRIAMDFGNEPLIIAGARVASFTVTCAGAGAPTVSGRQLDYFYQLSALFAGGTAGTYDAVFAVTLDDTDATIISRTGVLKVL